MEEVQGGLNIAAFLLLVKCYDNKMVKLPYNCDIYPLTQTQVANQKKIKFKNEIKCKMYIWHNFSKQSKKGKCDDNYLFNVKPILRWNKSIII